MYALQGHQHLVDEKADAARQVQENIPLLILFMGALRLDGLRIRKGSSTVGGHAEITGLGCGRDVANACGGGPVRAGASRTDPSLHNTTDN